MCLEMIVLALIIWLSERIIDGTESIALKQLLLSNPNLSKI